MLFLDVISYYLRFVFRVLFAVCLFALCPRAVSVIRLMLLSQRIIHNLGTGVVNYCRGCRTKIAVKFGTKVSLRTRTHTHFLDPPN